MYMKLRSFRECADGQERVFPCLLDIAAVAGAIATNSGAMLVMVNGAVVQLDHDLDVVEACLIAGGHHIITPPDQDADNDVSNWNPTIIVSDTDVPSDDTKEKEDDNG